MLRWAVWVLWGSCPATLWTGAYSDNRINTRQMPLTEAAETLRLSHRCHHLEKDTAPMSRPPRYGPARRAATALRSITAVCCAAVASTTVVYEPGQLVRAGVS